MKRVAGRSESIYLILTCKHCFGKITIVGQGFDMEYVSNEKAIEVV